MRSTEIIDALDALYRDPSLHPPLVRDVCPLHDGFAAAPESDAYCCPRCGLVSRHERLGEEAYYAAYVAAERSGDPDAPAGVEAAQDAAEVLRRVEAARAALGDHPLKVERLDAPALCRHCFPGRQDVRIELAVRCLSCDRLSEYVLDLDGFQEFLTALWFHPSQLRAPALTTRIPLRFCIRYFFCDACGAARYPEVFRGPR
jgi:hypothetical protein